MKTVKVYINRSPGRWLRGYEPGDPLDLAVEFLVTFGQADDVIKLLETIFAELNRDVPTHEILDLPPARIAEYHRKFPSLSIGDVVIIEGSEEWGVNPIGFAPVTTSLF